jgi:cytochrome c553
MRLAIPVLALTFSASAIAAPPSPDADAAAVKAPDWSVEDHMELQFAFVTDALFFTFAGDLDTLREKAGELAELEQPKDKPASWAPHLKKMQEQAASLAKVESLDDAAKGVVAISSTCSGCHEAHKKPDMEYAAFIQDPDLFGDKPMDRHQWGTYLMWIGLVVPDEKTWQTGLKALEHKKGMLPDVPVSAAPLEAVVHTWSESAAKAEGWEARRTAFAGMLTTCAACHTKLEVEVP